MVLALQAIDFPVNELFRLLEVLELCCLISHLVNAAVAVTVDSESSSFHVNETAEQVVKMVAFLDKRHELFLHHLHFVVSVRVQV